MPFDAQFLRRDTRPRSQGAWPPTDPSAPRPEHYKRWMPSPCCALSRRGFTRSEVVGSDAWYQRHSDWLGTEPCDYSVSCASRAANERLHDESKPAKRLHYKQVEIYDRKNPRPGRRVRHTLEEKKRLPRRRSREMLPLLGDGVCL